MRSEETCSRILRPRDGDAAKGGWSRQGTTGRRGGGGGTLQRRGVACTRGDGVKQLRCHVHEPGRDTGHVQRIDRGGGRGCSVWSGVRTAVPPHPHHPFRGSSLCPLPLLLILQRLSQHHSISIVTRSRRRDSPKLEQMATPEIAGIGALLKPNKYAPASPPTPHSEGCLRPMGRLLQPRDSASGVSPLLAAAIARRLTWRPMVLTVRC